MVYLQKKPKIGKILNILGTGARYDVTGVPCQLQKKTPNFISSSVGKSGKCIPLFRVLQTNFCIHNCSYCLHRKDSNTVRMRVDPETLAVIFMEYYRKKKVKGLFLSSGTFPTANHAQERMLATIEILRNQHNYHGYIHTVILPGADLSYIAELGKYSNRLSVNLEVPAQRYLEQLAPTKDFQRHLWRILINAANYNKEQKLSAGLTTQLIVGAANETDEEILDLAQNLYNEDKLARIFYSGFQPVSGTPLENNKPCSPLREIRLYQADFLIRRYGFRVQELVFDKAGNLNLDKDPKLLWAQKHPEYFPVGINTARHEQLLRVPGVGVMAVRKIQAARKDTPINSLGQLKKLGVITNRAQNFITLNGKAFPTKPLKKHKLSQEQFLWEEL